MRLSDSLDPFRIPAFSIAAFAVLLVILSQAMAGSYMALMAVERAGMSPLELGAFLGLSGVSSLTITTLFAHWHDRRPTLWPLFVCLGAGVLGYALCAVVSDPFGLMAIAFLLLGFGNSAFTLLFAVAKHSLDAGSAATASRGMAVLRMASSLSWAVGPAIGAALVGVWRYEGVFFGAGGIALAALVAVLAGRLQAGAQRVDVGTEVPVRWWAIWPAALALTLFHMALFMGSNALAIVTVSDLHGSEADVGLLFSLCAAIEVVVMSAFVIWPVSQAGRAALVVGFVVFAAYYLACLLLPGLSTLYWIQLLRGTAIALVTVLGMLYIQQAMLQRAGGAAALYSNAVNLAGLLSGIGTGLWARAFGYWSIFGLCAALALAGGALFAISRFPHAAPESWFAPGAPKRR